MNDAVKSLPMGNHTARLKAALQSTRLLTLASVPDGYAGKAVADVARAAADAQPLVLVARDGQRLAEIERALGFFAPEIELLNFPAWDCLPYDRVSPHPGIVAERVATLSRLAQPLDTIFFFLTMVSPCMEIFIIGKSRSALATASIKMGVKVKFSPSRFKNASFILFLQFQILVTSASIKL
jgi:transcription-repair coupling factor (superfamily II helicase)